MPSNAGYFIAAYVATALVYSLYGLSIATRARRLRERLASSGDSDGAT